MLLVNAAHPIAKDVLRLALCFWCASHTPLNKQDTDFPVTPCAIVSFAPSLL